jgi:phospho-N-acetylmuramoyl-pentapeptide-transferase
VLYHLFVPLEDAVSGFHLFRYVTFRAAFAALLAFLVATILGPGVIATLRARKLAGTALTGSVAVDERRLAKRDVPTMGGVILLGGVGARPSSSPGSTWPPSGSCSSPSSRSASWARRTTGGS